MNKTTTGLDKAGGAGGMKIGIPSRVSAKFVETNKKKKKMIFIPIATVIKYACVANCEFAGLSVGPCTNTTRVLFD